MRVTDAKGRAPGPGEWWWAYVAGKPEPVWLVRPAPAVPGKWEVDAAGISTLVVASPLEPVVPYVPASAPARSPRYDPRPGDTYTAPPGAGGLTFTVISVDPDGVVVKAPNRHDGIARWLLDFWITSHGYGTWTAASAGD